MKRHHIKRFLGVFLAISLSVISTFSFSQTSHKKIIAGTPIYANKKVGDYVQSILNKLIAANVKSNKHYDVYVLDSPGINAFITPSNNMYIYRGLLSYLTSEAELAAIIAHELGHIRDRHALKHKATRVTKFVAATSAAIYTGNADIARTVDLFAQVQASGYGRELELKADKIGAKYLYNAGYSPSALKDVLTLLKNHQRFVKYTAKESGTSYQTYHGIFSSHPRNDLRLLKIIDKTGELPPNEDIIGRKPLRKALDGMIFGVNSVQATTDSFTYVHRKHGIAVTLSNQWQPSENSDTVTFTNTNDATSLSFQTFRKSRYNCDKQAQAKNATNVDPHTNSYETIQQPNYYACIQIGTRSFYFVGKAASATLSEEAIKSFRELVSNFHRITQDDYKIVSTKTIYYQRARPGDSFAKLASNGILGKHTEEYLRLINGFYPKGEPEPGLWLKRIK